MLKFVVDSFSSSLVENFSCISFRFEYQDKHFVKINQQKIQRIQQMDADPKHSIFDHKTFLSEIDSS